MKHLPYILFLILIVGCNSEITNKEEENVTEVTTKVNQSGVALESFDCNDCEKYQNKKYHLTQINFSNEYFLENEQDSIFKYYSNDSLRLSITSIGFAFFDTIPSKFKIFENAENIRLTSCNTTQGIDMFPKIKSICIFGSVITINQSEKWLKNIQGFYAIKTWISGIQSFSDMPKLQEIVLRYSAFDKIPSGFGANKCIKNIEFFAYAGKGDLNEIDLTNLKCLKSVTLHSWYGPMTGIPKGIDSAQNFNLNIYHKQLTEQEKQIISNATQ
jgi:hypothetical protein